LAGYSISTAIEPKQKMRACRVKSRTYQVANSLARLALHTHVHRRILRRNVFDMPEQETIERAREDAREGKSPSTQAGEFVREEIEHVREGKHGARSAKQAIAIGLSKARRAGVKLPAKERNFRADEKTSDQGFEKRSNFQAPEILTNSFAGGEKGAQAGATFCRFSPCVISTSTFGRAPAQQS
jgi:hypothetical protein